MYQVAPGDVVKTIKHARSLRTCGSGGGPELSDRLPDPFLQAFVGPDDVVSGAGRGEAFVAGKELTGVTDLPWAHAKDDWAQDVLERLREAALPVLRRQQPISPEAATAIRVPALFLAAEAVNRGAGDLAADFRQLAAAVCLLQDRVRDSSLLETIVLATA